MDKNEVLRNLPERVKAHFWSLEQQTGLNIEVVSLPSNCTVISQYQFIPNPTNKPIIMLRNDWTPVDVAHELEHMEMELIDGYYVLAWRMPNQQSNPIEETMSKVRNTTDDEVVHARLVAKGYMLDGEVIKSIRFDVLYPDFIRKINAGRTQFEDIFYREFVQAELMLKSYSKKLKSKYSIITNRFIDAFRLQRNAEAQKADLVIELFNQYDVQTINGHKAIITGWSQIEELDRLVGVSYYERRGSGFILLWP